MSNRDALRKLSRKSPTRPEIFALIQQIMNGEPLSAAITGTAILEMQLEALIKSKFKRTNANLCNQIFLNNGPLSTFSSKILVAEAFGIIPVRIAEQLNAFRVIRNAFAHSATPLSFETPEIAKEIMSLGAIDAVKTAVPEMKLTAQGWFGMLVLFIHGVLERGENIPIHVLREVWSLTPDEAQAILGDSSAD